MDIEQLRCVVEVVRQKTFLDAAAELNRSQSSVSKSIQKLESELGVPIFARTTRRVALTQVGEDIYAYAERILACYEGMLHSAKQYRNGDERKLRLGSIYFGLNNRLVPYVAEFLKLHPSMQIDIEESTTTPLLQKLEKNELDVIFVSSMYLKNGEKHNFSENFRYRSMTFSLDPYYVIVSREHPLAKRKILRYEEIADEPFITTDHTMDVYHKAFHEAFAQAGCQAQITMQCTNVRSVLHMVSQNVGIAILSKLVLEEADDLVMIPLENPLLRDTQMVILERKHVPAQIDAFYHFIQTSLNTPPLPVLSPKA